MLASAVLFATEIVGLFLSAMYAC